MMDAFEYGLTLSVVVLWAGLSLAESELPVFVNPPTMKNHTGNSITIYWKRWSPSLDKGQGVPVSYRVEISGETGVWRTLQEVDANEWSERNDGFEITLIDLQTRTSQFLRVVVVDQSGEAETYDVPVVHIPPATHEKGNEQNVTVHEKGNEQNVTVHEDNPKETFHMKKHIEEWAIWIGIAAGGAFLTAILIVIVIECTKKNRYNIVPPKGPQCGRCEEISKVCMTIPRDNECCLELVENNANGSNLGLENPGYVTLRSETMRSCRSTNGKSDKKGAVKVDLSSSDKKSKHRKTRSNQMVSTLCSQGKQKTDNHRSVDDATDSRYPRDSDGSWYTEWYDSRTYENTVDACRVPSVMKHFSSCQEKY